MVGGGVNTAGCLRTLTPRFQGNLNFELVKYVVCERLCYWHMFYFWHVQICLRQNALQLVCDGNVFLMFPSFWYIYFSPPNKETRRGISTNYVLRPWHICLDSYVVYGGWKLLSPFIYFLLFSFKIQISGNIPQRLVYPSLPVIFVIIHWAGLKH